MSIFDTLAENRYQQWLKASQQPGYKPPAPLTATRSRLSFEGMLYQQVLALLERAGDTRSASEREELFEEAGNIEFQLVVALEKKGLPRVVQTLRESIREHRNSARSAEAASQ